MNKIMKKTNAYYATLCLNLFTLMFANQVRADAADDPLLTLFMLEQLEYRDADEDNPAALSGQFWAGYDLDKLWIKAELERSDGVTEEAELQALYSKAIAPYWDFQMGLRKDFQPSDEQIPSRDWVVVGFQGLAPYFFEVDTALFLGESGRSALRLEAEYEMLLTQRLILSPEIELNIYGQNDPLTGVGSGLSDIQAGLRLRYEIKREFAPYIGINWSKKFGNTAHYSSLEGQPTSETQIVLGFRVWF